MGGDCTHFRWPNRIPILAISVSVSVGLLSYERRLICNICSETRRQKVAMTKVSNVTNGMETLSRALSLNPAQCEEGPCGSGRIRFKANEGSCFYN